MATSVQVALSTTPARLSGPAVGTYQSILVQAPAAATLYVGGSDVTSANGFPVAAGQSLAVDLLPHDELYGVLASGSGTASVLRLGGV